MKLSDFKTKLNTLDTLRFMLPDGTYIPKHFHITEVGEVSKNFIDCGGTVRLEKVVNFQLWEANDFDHRLTPAKLDSIIGLSQTVLGIGNLEIEIEYQTETISKYGVEFIEGEFVFTSLHTNCLALDKCGVSPEKLKVNLKDISSSNTCTPGGGCC